MRYMLTFTWKQPPGEEVMKLMPAEEARVGELLEQGIAEPPELAADQSTFWQVWNRANPDEVQETLKTLPLFEFMNVDIKPLAPKEQ